MIKKKKVMIQLSRGCVNSEPEGQEIKHEEVMEEKKKQTLG